VTVIHSPINAVTIILRRNILVTQSFYSRILTTRIVVQYISTTRISDLYMTAARILASFMAYKTNVCPCLHQKAICGTRLFADVDIGSSIIRGNLAFVGDSRCLPFLPRRVLGPFAEEKKKSLGL
jgi:hypothetical protein